VTNRVCLITGGAGFIGQHLVNALLHDGWAVKIIGRSPISNQILDGSVEYHSGSFGDLGILRKVMPGVTLLVHLASTTTPAKAYGRSAFDVESNLIGTLNLLEEAVRSNVDRVVFPSSGGTVYGKVIKTPITEKHSTRPISSHGIIKLAIENYIQMLSHEKGLNYTILRISNPYGPGQRADSTQGVIAVMAGKILRNQPVVIWGDGSIVRDFLYIDDLVRAFISSINSDAAINQIFNIGVGQGIAINDVLSILVRATNKNPEVRFESSRGFDVPVNVLNITKSNKLLNWSPSVSLDVGINRTIAWLEQTIRSEQ